MSIISKIKMPGMADAYDIGVDWENVKDKPDVGSIDVGVTNEVLNIDTNNDIAVSGSSNSEIPAWTTSDESKVLTVNEVGTLVWEQPHEVFTLSSDVVTYISSFFLRILNGNAHPTQRLFLEDLTADAIEEYQTMVRSNYMADEQTGNFFKTMCIGHGFCIIKINNNLYQSFLDRKSGKLYINIPFMSFNNNGSNIIISGTLMVLENGLGFSGLIDTLQGSTNITYA